MTPQPRQSSGWPRINLSEPVDWHEVAKATRGERDRYRDALVHLMAFGKQLMASEDMEERGIGCCICEGARVVEDA